MGAQAAHEGGGLAREVGRVVGDARVQRPAAAHGGIERAHGFVQRRLWVGPVVIEDVDIGQAHALEALVQAGE